MAGYPNAFQERHGSEAGMIAIPARLAFQPQAHIVSALLGIFVVLEGVAVVECPVVVRKEHLARLDGELHEQVGVVQMSLHGADRFLLRGGQGDARFLVPFQDVVIEVPHGQLTPVPPEHGLQRSGRFAVQDLTAPVEVEGPVQCRERFTMALGQDIVEAVGTGHLAFSARPGGPQAKEGDGIGHPWLKGTVRVEGGARVGHGEARALGVVGPHVAHVVQECSLDVLDDRFVDHLADQPVDKRRLVERETIERDPVQKDETQPRLQCPDQVVKEFATAARLLRGQPHACDGTAAAAPTVNDGIDHRPQRARHRLDPAPARLHLGRGPRSFVIDPLLEDPGVRGHGSRL